MFHRYDTVFGVSTYRSVDAAVRFLRSAHNLHGENLIVMTCPVKTEITEIVEQVKRFPIVTCDMVFMFTTWNCHVAGRSWAFPWCVGNDIEAAYFCECDDDIEWIPDSKDILRRLGNTRYDAPYSIMGFDSTHPMHYPDFEKQQGNLKIGVPWIDGNVIFTQWSDNLKYGVMDGLPDAPLSFFVETEYSHRMRYLSGRPIVIDCEKQFYKHHFREDPIQVRERRPTYQSAVVAGQKFWHDKFNLDVEFKGDIHSWLYQKETTDPNAKANFRKHMLFHGKWNEWGAIYNSYRDRFKIIGATI